MPEFSEKEEIADPRTWKVALGILAAMVVGFILHDDLHWEPWFVAALGLTALVFLGSNVEMDDYFSEVEITLLVFFMSLFILIGGVEHSQFLQFIGQFIVPFVQKDLLTASIMLMWLAAVLSAMIDNIPFTAAMIPIILGMETQGINVAPLWWALAAGVGMGGNGTHLGSTANVFIVTISEKLAKDSGNLDYAITPAVWFRKGTSVILFALVICSVIMTLFFDFFSAAL